VDDGRLSRIGRRAVIKVPAQIDDPQALSSLASGFARTMRALGGSQRPICIVPKRLVKRVIKMAATATPT